MSLLRRTRLDEAGLLAEARRRQEAFLAAQQAAYQANPGCGSHDGEYKHEQSERLLL
jgi:hypothetical protein